MSHFPHPWKENHFYFGWVEIEGEFGLPGDLTIDQNVVATIYLLKVAHSLAFLEGDIE